MSLSAVKIKQKMQIYFLFLGNGVCDEGTGLGEGIENEYNKNCFYLFELGCFAYVCVRVIKWEGIQARIAWTNGWQQQKKREKKKLVIENDACYWMIDGIYEYLYLYGWKVRRNPR